MRKFLATMLLALSLTACSVDPTATMVVENKSDWQVTRIAVIVDDLAYDGRRGIYLVRNSVTGQEYVGVSGVGISEIGQHTCGKSCVTTDER